MLWLSSDFLEHPFFEGMPPHHLQMLAECASAVQFDAGQVVFREGGHADRFYLVERGRVALEVAVPGRGLVQILTIHGGDVLGWSWLFAPYTWTFSARALDVTAAFSFDAEHVRKLCDQNHELGYDLMRRFAQVVTLRLQATRLQLLDVYAAHPSSEVSYART